MPTQTKVAQRFSGFIISCWFVGVGSPLILLGAFHLPMPPLLEERSFSDNPDSEWCVHHFLAGGCPCSKTIARHLIDQESLKGAIQRVHIIGPDSGLERLLAMKFPIQSQSPESAFEQFGVTGGPCMLIVSPEGRVAYRGGYGPRRPNSLIIPRVDRVLEAVVSGRPQESHPIYGCTTETSILKTLDPLGFK